MRYDILMMMSAEMRYDILMMMSAEIKSTDKIPMLYINSYNDLSRSGGYSA